MTYYPNVLAMPPAAVEQAKGFALAMAKMAFTELRWEISDEWLFILSGIASVIFGVLVTLFPGAGALSVIWLIAAYVVVFGVLLVALSLRLRSLGR